MFTVEDHISLVLIRPHTDEVLLWLEEHAAEDAKWVGGALVIEPRQFQSIIAGLFEAGFAEQADAASLS